MPKCWNCGEEVPENATFCPMCGQFIAPSTSQQAPPYDRSRHSRYQHNPMGPNSSMQESQLERKVNNLYKLVIVVLVLEAIIFIIG
jgi:uncharacterized membrane protein YvbJ